MLRSPRRSRLLAAPVALLLILAACGDDDDDDTADTAAADVTEPAGTEPAVTEPAGTEPAGTEPADTASSGTASGETYGADEYVDALADEIGGDEDSARCVGEAFVNAVGVERLEASGVPPEDFATSGSPADVGLEIDPANAASMQSDLEACPSLIDLFAEAADPPTSRSTAFARTSPTRRSPSCSSSSSSVAPHHRSCSTRRAPPRPAPRSDSDRSLASPRAGASG